MAEMSLTPLLKAGPVIASHALAALLAVFLGAAQLLSPKGTTRHKALGYAWVVLLTFVALSSFGIHIIRVWGLFSPIHILSVLTILMLVFAVAVARLGKITTHRQTMLWVYAMALVLTGFFTLWPGRIMHQVLFGT